LNYYIYLLPAFGAFIAVLSVFITYVCLWRKLEKSKAQILENLGKKIGKADFHEIVDDKMEGLIQDFKEQIPMGNMLFTPALSGKIRDIAKKGLLNMLPDIKKRLLIRLSLEMSIEAILFKFLRPLLFLIIIYAAFVGFVLGLIWVFLDQRQ
jgi:hypothetical protein